MSAAASCLKAVRQWMKRGFLSGKPSGVVRGVTDLVFYPAFAFCYAWMFLRRTTMFKGIMSRALKKKMDSWFDICMWLILAVGIATMLLFQSSVRVAVFQVLLLAAGYVGWKTGGGKQFLFVLCVLIVGATGKSFRLILGTAFLVGTAIMAAAFYASQAGIIEDLVYRGGRHSYGIIYCTDCAAHILFLMLSYAVLRAQRMRVFDYAVLGLGFVFMLGTRAKTDILSALLIFAGLVLFHFLSRNRGKHENKIRIGAAVMSFSYLLCALFSFLVTLNLRTDTLIIKLLGHTLAKRLELGLRALQEHPFTFFGTNIKEYGFGGKTTDLPGWDVYFFIDCSYVRLYVIGGAVLFAMLLMVITYAQLRCYSHKQYEIIYFLTVAALVCIMEHHFMEYFYNIFPVMAFTNAGFYRRSAPKKERGRRAEKEGLMADAFMYTAPLSLPLPGKGQGEAHHQGVRGQHPCSERAIG